MLNERLGKTAEIITLRAIALKPKLRRVMEENQCRDHNATSYSTETLHQVSNWFRCVPGRDHNATSYSTETLMTILHRLLLMRRDHNATSYSTETAKFQRQDLSVASRDHNATSYSTETQQN